MINNATSSRYKINRQKIKLLVENISIKELSQDIREAISQLKSRPEIEKVGVVTRVGDGVAWKRIAFRPRTKGLLDALRRDVSEALATLAALPDPPGSVRGH